MDYVTADHLSKQKQQDQGAFYTPKEIAEKMASMVEYKPGMKILDPTIGKGNLFVAMINVHNISDYSCLYGVDIDAEAIKFCIDKFPGGNFQCGDCLEDNLTDDDFWKKDPFDTSGKYKQKSFAKMFGKI